MVLEYSDNTIERRLFFFFFLARKGEVGDKLSIEQRWEKIYDYPYTIFVLFQERFSWYYFGNWLFKFNVIEDAHKREMLQSIKRVERM